MSKDQILIKHILQAIEKIDEKVVWEKAKNDLPTLKGQLR